MPSKQEKIQNNQSNDVFDKRIKETETKINKETTQKLENPEGLDYGLDNKNLRKININKSEENLLIYGSNYIKTTKYTLISFIPLSLIYQYKRIANIYFLFCLFLSFFPEITPFGPISQLLPTGFVLLVAMLREGLEDFFRHLSDVESNQQPAYKVFCRKKDQSLIIENNNQISEQVRPNYVKEFQCKLQKIKSSEIVTGDILWIPNDSELAADVLLVGGGNLTKQGAQIECFVQTSSLDGEKNLKRKQCPKGLVLQYSSSSQNQIEQSFELIKDSKGNIEDNNQPNQDQLPIVDGMIICELPNKDLHEFHGTLLIDQDDQTKEVKTQQQNQNTLKNFQKFAVNEKHILLRGSRLTNTPTGVFGVVVYSGMDTKLMQNQNKKRHKQSRLEVEINKTVAGMLSFLVVACFVITSLSYRWQTTEMDNAIYLHKGNINLKNLTTQPKNYPPGTEALPSSAGVWSFIIMFLSALLLYSTFIPVSLIVQFECVKVVQGLWLQSDIELVSVEYEQDQKKIIDGSSRQDKYIEKQSDGKRLPINYTPCGVKTWALNEELGQVRIVFSDKTGTLTQNMMEFRLCKIGLEIYGDHNKFEENLGEIHESKFDFQKEDKDVIFQKSILVSKIDIDSHVNLEEIDSKNQEFSKNLPEIIKIEDVSHESKLSQEARINIQKVRSITVMGGYVNKMEQDQNLYLQDQAYQVELNISEHLQSPQQLPLLTEKSNKKDDELEFQKTMAPIFFEQLAKNGQNKSLSSHGTVSSHRSAASKRSVANKKQGASYCYKNSDLENLLFGESPTRDDIFAKQENFSIQLKPSQFFQPINMYSFQGELLFQITSQKQMSKEFLKCLSTAHECMAKESTDQENPKIHYQGSSPDEVALLEFAQEHGYEFYGANDESISVRRKKKIDGIWQQMQELKFELVRKMEFSSDRKRMSCIIFDREHQVYKLYCKGADNVIKERLHDCYFDSSVEHIYQQTLNETDQFLYQASKQGYRTLLMAMRILSPKEVDDLLTQFKIAESDLTNRNLKLEQVYSEYEKDLILLGATVVEDRLQNQVPETISALHQADIKVWVLTGDKLETAESIGYSSKLLTLEMDIVKINSVSEMKALCTRERAFMNDFEIKKGKKRALLIEAIALRIVLANADNPENLQIKRWFLKISKTMHTVICCRVSPSQKAEVVRLVKSDDKDLITLAIGDGANDVPMILEADIGIGIYGKEGMRAVDSSDFALAEFRLLWPLLFKQGRLMYYRLSIMVNFFFYKNFIYTLFQLMFGIYNGYSSTSIYPDSLLTMYNLLFSSYPITAISFIDFDVFPSSQEPQENQNEYSQDPLTYLKAYDPASLRQFIPNLYFPGQRNLSYNQYLFYWWNFRGLIECIIIFFIAQKIFQEGGIMNEFGQPADMWCFSLHIFTCLMIVVHNKNSLLHKKVDITVFLTHLILSWFAYIFFCYCTSQNSDFQHAYSFEITFSSPHFYLTCLICSSICLIIDLIIQIFSQKFMGDTRDLLRFQAIKHKGEITETFLNDFNNLVSIQKNLAQIEDSFREQELEWYRALQSGLTQQQFVEEQSLSQKQILIQNDKFDKESLKTTENISSSQKSFISSIVPTNSPFGLNSYLRPFKSILNRYINIHRQSLYQQVNINTQRNNNQEHQNIGSNDNPNITINQAPIDHNNVNLEIQQKQSNDPAEKQVLSDKTTVINSSISKLGKNKVHQHQSDQLQANYEQLNKNSIEFFQKSPEKCS